MPVILVHHDKVGLPEMLLLEHRPDGRIKGDGIGPHHAYPFRDQVTCCLSCHPAVVGQVAFLSVVRRCTRFKERDIVLIQTGASAYNTEKRYLTDHCGMTAEATRYLISKGVRMMGTDAVTFDPPVWAMFEQKHFWEAHLVMMDEDYWHIENLMNLDKLPPHGFRLSVFPIKWIGTTAAPVRAVAIFEE